MRLLHRLPAEDQARLRPHLQPTEMGYRQSLYCANQPIETAYFPESGVASMVCTMENGQAVEVGTIGNEGVVGLPALFGDTTPPHAVYVQVPGYGLQMAMSILRHEFDRSDSLRNMILLYARSMFNQLAQSAACSHFHDVEQRACRWLLMTHDRMLSDEFLLTHEFFAMMLGVRRQGVSKVAGLLQEAGLIRYHRGTITILDRCELEKRACECYAVSRRDFNELLGTEEVRITATGRSGGALSSLPKWSSVGQ